MKYVKKLIGILSRNKNKLLSLLIVFSCFISLLLSSPSYARTRLGVNHSDSTKYNSTSFDFDNFDDFDDENFPVFDDEILPELDFTQSKINISVNQTYQLKLKGDVKENSDKLTWISDNGNVSVSKTGLVKGLVKGVSIVTVYYKDNPDIYACIIVNVTSVMMKDMKVSGFTLLAGNSKQISPSITPSNTSNKKLTYTSSNPSIATVSSTGKVKGLKKGAVRIIIKSTDGSNISRTITVTVKSVIVVLDPGHGAHDSGATRSKPTAYEKCLNLTMALACKKELEKYAGIKVYMTRSTDKFIKLDKRCAIAKSYNADLFVSLHQNASNGKAHGSMVFHTQCKAKDKFYNQSRKVAKSILTQLNNYGFSTCGKGLVTRSATDMRYSNGQYADYYAVIRGCIQRDIPSLIVEHAFIDSSDYFKMNTTAKQQEIGRRDATGIAKYFGLKKKS